MNNQIIRALGNVSRRPDLTAFRSGQIDISSAISKSLGIEAGDVIDIAQLKGEYYLYIRAKGNTLRGRHQAQCHNIVKGNNRHNFRAYSRKITDMLLSVSGLDKAPIIAGQVVDLQGIGKALTLIPSYVIRNE